MLTPHGSCSLIAALAAVVKQDDCPPPNTPSPDGPDFGPLLGPLGSLVGRTEFYVVLVVLGIFLLLREGKSMLPWSPESRNIELKAQELQNGKEERAEERQDRKEERKNHREEAREIRAHELAILRLKLQLKQMVEVKAGEEEVTTLRGTLPSQVISSAPTLMLPSPTSNITTAIRNQPSPSSPTTATQSITQAATSDVPSRGPLSSTRSNTHHLP